MTEQEIPTQIVSPEKTVPLRVLFTLGKNIGVDWTGERIRKTHGHLSDSSEINVFGAGEALEQGYADVVFFTVTNTAGDEPLSQEDGEASGDTDGIGKPMKSEAYYMKQRFIQEFPNLADKVFVQENSWDTNTDAKEAKKIIDSQPEPETQAMLMTVGYHTPRAFDLFRSEGIKINLVLSSDRILLNSKDPSRRRMAVDYRSKELRHAKEQIKESVAHAVMIFPPLKDRISEKTKDRMTKTDTA